MSALSDSLCGAGITPQKAKNLIADWTTEIEAEYPLHQRKWALDARGYGYLIENFSIDGDMTLGDIKIKGANAGQIKFWQRKLDAAEKSLGLHGSRARPMESVILPLHIWTTPLVTTASTLVEYDPLYPGFYPGFYPGS